MESNVVFVDEALPAKAMPYKIRSRANDMASLDADRCTRHERDIDLSKGFRGIEVSEDNIVILIRLFTSLTSVFNFAQDAAEPTTANS